MDREVISPQCGHIRGESKLRNRVVVVKSFFTRSAMKASTARIRLIEDLTMLYDSDHPHCDRSTATVLCKIAHSSLARRYTAKVSNSDQQSFSA
ncbi:MAG: hypothetical protein WAN70_04740 [Terriglobales bacterium]|jgi:hypothetical protein